MSKEYKFKCIVEKEGDIYCALCLDLDIATEGATLDEALENLNEAIGLYLITAIEKGEEKEFIPRPVPNHILGKYKECGVAGILKLT
jgi:predicted RNase H-like HicB family nuclease